MRRAEEGYATAGMIALMAALSLISSSYLGVALSENKRADALVERAQADGRLDQAVFGEIARFLDVQYMPRLGAKTTEINGQSISLHISDEQARLDLNRAPIGDLSAALRDTNFSSQTVSNLTRFLENARSEARVSFESVEELRAFPGLSGNDAACLIAQFSLYRSSLNPIVATRREAQKFSMVGAILRIDARSVSEDLPPRGVEAVVLFSGDHRNPYRLMEWRRYSDYIAETCSQL